MLWDIASIIRETKSYIPSRTSEEMYTEIAEKEFNQIIIPDLLEHDGVYSALEESLKEGERYRLCDLDRLAAWAVSNPKYTEWWLGLA